MARYDKSPGYKTIYFMSENIGLDIVVVASHR